jgi:hypothetical protein
MHFMRFIRHRRWLKDSGQFLGNQSVILSLLLFQILLTLSPFLLPLLSLLGTLYYFNLIFFVSFNFFIPMKKVPFLLVSWEKIFFLKKHSSLLIHFYWLLVIFLSLCSVQSGWVKIIVKPTAQSISKVSLKTDNSKCSHFYYALALVCLECRLNVFYSYRDIDACLLWCPCTVGLIGIKWTISIKISQGFENHLNVTFNFTLLVGLLFFFVHLDCRINFWARNGLLSKMLGSFYNFTLQSSIT